ncbi:MAG: hypothetical protein Q9171_002978 [Xanthocarpia ochracea]
MFGGPPMSHGRAFCQQFYGNFPDARHCQYAIRNLPAGDQEVTYIADGRHGLYNLPQTRQSGRCMIQVELAGERTPPTFQVAPNQIREMATSLLNVCDNGKTYGGGFITGSLEGMAGWLTSQFGELDAPMPHYTSFLTVTLSNPFPFYISPGNNDPDMAYLFSQAVFEAAKELPPAAPLIAKLRARGNRLMEVKKLMEPRGRRIPWWTDPRVPPNSQGLDRVGNATDDALQGDALAVAGDGENPPAPGSAGDAAQVKERPQGSDENAGTATARKGRRKRRAILERRAS